MMKYRCCKCEKEFEDHRKFGAHMGGHSAKERAEKRRKLRMKKKFHCEKCNIAFEELVFSEQENVRFCSRSCANSRVDGGQKKKTKCCKCGLEIMIGKRANSNNSKCDVCRNNVSLDRTCFVCDKKIQDKNKSGYCQRHVYLYKFEERIEKTTNAIRQHVKDGTHKGWQSRNITSYPEKFFKNVLANNNIEYKHNKKVGKYFIDFALKNKIGLEIDGKQHLYPEKMKDDIVRDAYLEDQMGWRIYRIRWVSINNENGRVYMKKEIDKFLDFYNSDFCCMDAQPF